MSHDPLGRFEVGFPRRAWPRDVRPVGGVDLRWVSDQELAQIVDRVQGQYPVYRSVYRFTEPEHGTPPSQRKTAIVDHAFWEFEDHACGRLCKHTMLAVRQFGHRLMRNRMVPQIIYSGGKSLHVYVHTDAVELSHPHDTIKSVARAVVQKARAKCWDPAANLALSQIARVPNVQNPKSGLYAIPVTFEDVVSRSESYIQRLAEEPQPMPPEITRTPMLAELFQYEDERVRKRQVVDDLLPRPTPVAESAECAYFQRVLQNGVADGTGRHHALVSVIDHYRQQGWDKNQVRQAVAEWNHKNRPPLSPGVIGHQVAAQFRRPGSYSPCAMLRSRGLHPKGECKKVD